MRSSIRLAGVAFVLAALAACTSQHGEEGNFYFSYVHPGIWAFGTDAAVGTRVDVGVWADEEATVPVDVSSAAIEGEAFEIVERDLNLLTLEALAAGDAELSIEAADELHDHVELTADAFDTVEWHVPDPFQVSSQEGDFAAGGTALIPVDIQNGDELLIGYSLEGVTADPPAAATIGEQSSFRDVYFLHVDFEAAGAVTLAHPAAEDLAVTVVEPTAVTSLAWDDFGATTVALDGLATPLFLEARQTGDRLVFGLLGVATLESTTPTTCAVNASTLWGDGVYEVSGRATGPCTVRATVNALTAEWTADVVATE